MKKKSETAPTPTTLRRHAETRLRKQTTQQSASRAMARTPAESLRLVHELQVHQIELQMQNEELRAARNELEAGLEKYSELYDFAPVGYLTLDREGVIREANLTMANLLRVPRESLVKKRLGSLVTLADRAVYHAFLAQVFGAKGRKECDVGLAVKDQPLLNVRMRAERSDSGEAFRVAITDITQHKFTEEAAARLAAIVTSSSDAIVGKDMSGLVTSWNAGAEKLFGYTEREMVGRSITRLVPPDRLDEENEIMARIRKGERVEPIETVRVAKDGRRLDMSVTLSPVRQAGGKIVGASTVARDITAQKRTEDKVRVSEIRYRRLFEAAHDGVLLIDPGTRKITDANPFMTTLLGYPREQLIGKELFEIGLLKDETASQEMFQKLTRKHEVRYEDLPLESHQGRHQEVEVVANLYQENGHSVIQCNIRDITARKQAEDVLRETRAQVAAYAGQLENLVAVRTAQLTAANRRLSTSVETTRKAKEEYRALFHESEVMQKKFRQLTRQVLTAQEDERRHISRELHDVVVQTLVGINVELAALGRVAGTGARSLKTKIGRTQRLVEKSVHAVHQFARELRPAVLDDLGLIPALQAFMKTIAARNKMKLHLTAFAGVETLDNDRRTVLYRVAQEALTNVVRHAEASRVDVQISEISGAVRMEVCDNGKSFDVARALSAKTNKRLGLLGMRERVEMLGGVVTIKSVAGHGSTVRAEMPFRKGSAT